MPPCKISYYIRRPWSGRRGAPLSPRRIFNSGVNWRQWSVQRKLSLLHICGSTSSVCNVITSDTICHVTAEWIPHLCLCIFHNGGHIEQILWIQAIFIIFPYVFRLMGHSIYCRKYFKITYNIFVTWVPLKFIIVVIRYHNDD